MNDPELHEPMASVDDEVETRLRTSRSSSITPPNNSSPSYYQPKRTWFASTAFPLIAATFGPFSNLFSVCALVQTWRVTNTSPPHRVSDPPWLLAVNAVQLALGLFGNIVLLLGFAQRVSYVRSVLGAVVGWYLSAGGLIALVIASRRSLRNSKDEKEEYVFSQSYYYALIAGILYFTIATLLVANFLTNHYKSGHSKSKGKAKGFAALTIPQRTLMLQTVSYSLYLALGAGVFARIEGWNFVDGIYWADYTLLTIGLGSDFAPQGVGARIVVMIYAIGGILMVGLVVGSVRGLGLERGKGMVVRRTVEKERDKVIEERKRGGRSAEEEFGEMRRVQEKAEGKRKWWAFWNALGAVVVVWVGGAVGFWGCERGGQEWTYFEALYFTYTSLLTIGYGDFYPQSNAGKPFFVIWSLIAVPTVTILISSMGDTVVEWVKHGTLWLGQKTILPERRTGGKYQSWKQVEEDVEEEEDAEQDEEERQEDGEQATASVKDNGDLAMRIAREIKKLSKDVARKKKKRYGWEDWKRFLELMGDGPDGEDNEVEWKWLGDKGPLLREGRESEWVLERLCERLVEAVGDVRSSEKEKKETKKVG